MKYHNLQITAIIVLSLSLFSCRKYLDINKDPNNASTVDPKLLFSFAITTFVNNRAGGDLFIPMALAGQSMSSGGYSTNGISWGTGAEDQYVFSANNYGNIWTQYYTSAAANLKKSIELCETAVPKNNNGAAQSKVVLAQIFYELTTTYGDVPFSEALRADIAAPTFDAQQDVLNGCVALLDEAIAQFDPSSPVSYAKPYDMFYAGDIGKWMAVAKSIKLRILMTMVDKDPTKTTAIGELINSGGFLSSAADNFKVSFENTAGKRNPKFRLNSVVNAGIELFYASPYVLNFMQVSNDPRIPKFFDKAFGAADYHAIQPGDNADDAVDSKIASTIHTETEPEYVFTYQELLFYEAEIFTRGLGVPINMVMADSLYRQAITESAIFFGVDPGNAMYFAAGLPRLNVINDPLVQINYQHWIDMFDRGIDAFTQWRRSGPQGEEIPRLTLPVGAPAGDLFRRYEYPQNAELASNPHAPALVDFRVKMWFDL